jgi:hypothetical protein
VTAAATLVRTHWHRPEWCAVALAAGGWLALLAAARHEPGHLLGSDAVHGPGAAVSHAAVMSVAMMAPLVLDQVNHVATFSLWRRRYRAAAGYLLGYLGTWTVVMAGIVLAGGALSSAIGWRAAIALGFSIAIVAVFSHGRQRRLRQCSMTMPLALDGWRADRDCLWFGLATARRCVVTCWPLMVAVMIDHGVLVMAAGTAIPIAERRLGNVRPRSIAAAIAALAVVALGLAALVPGSASAA